MLFDNQHEKVFFHTLFHGVIFGIWLIQSIISFVKKRFTSGLQYILLIAIIIGVNLKITFYYHHFLFGLISIGGLLLTIYFNKKDADKSRISHQLLPFIAFGIICFSIPNIMFHKMLNHNIKSFSESTTYTLDDFKGTPPNKSVFKNLISTDIRYKLNNFGNHPDGVVIVGMRPEESYIIEIDTILNLESLNDFVKIKEVAGRKIRKLIAEKNVERIHMVDSINAIMRHYREIQEDYQEQVFEQNDTVLQKSIHEKLKTLLAEFDEYK
jgi:hypothetical protein